MKKYKYLFALLIFLLILSCSCSFLVKPLGDNMHFEEQLLRLEDFIRTENWEHADDSLKEVKEAWEKLKPWLQIEIDHDYVHEMEENLSKLEAYIDTEEQSDALAALLMIKETWEDMESF